MRGRKKPQNNLHKKIFRKSQQIFSVMKNNCFPKENQWEWPQACCEARGWQRTSKPTLTEVQGEGRLAPRPHVLAHTALLPRPTRVGHPPFT